MCSHPSTYGGLCVVCGVDVSASLTTKLIEPAIKHHKTPLIHREFHVSTEEARGIEEDGKRELRKSRKLLLVLDLDNTLIFAPSPAGFSRPYLVDFLESTSKNYKLVLYTQGDDMHAKMSLDRIDPTAKYFGGRFLARKRGDDPEDKRLDYLHSSPAYIVIMDDRLDVWFQHLPNLLPVPPYEGRTDDNYLKYVIPFLRNVHARFFQRLDSGEDADVREIISTDMQRKSILAGVGCAFTGIFPQNIEPTTHSFWAAAQLYGARCFHQLSEEGVTHLIANSETSKVQKALGAGLKVVTLEWLLDKWRWGLVSPDEQPQEDEYSFKARPAAPVSAPKQGKSQAAPEALREQAKLRNLKRAAEEEAIMQARPKTKAKPPAHPRTDLPALVPHTAPSNSASNTSPAASASTPASASVDSSAAQLSEADSFAFALPPPSAANPIAESPSLPSASVPPESQTQPPPNLVSASDT